MTKQILLSLLNCSWQWMLLGGLTWLITSSVFRKKRRSNTTVHLLWLLSLLSLPILFGLNQFVPALSISGPVPELTQVHAVDISGLTAQTAELPEIASPESNTQFQGHAGTGSTFFSTWTLTDLILSIWVIGTLAMLVRLVFGLYRIHQLRRSAVVADDSYQAICQRFARQLNIKRPVTVCFSDRVVSPISFGWLAPCILIPRTLNLEPFELVAAHELAHVQRLDWLTNLFSHLVGVIFFFHPIYHFLNRELVRVRERICDDWVIRLTGARKNYAQCLLDLVRHEERTVSLALSLNQPSQLESRIDSILKNNRRLDVQLKPRLRLILATLLLTCLPLLATAQLVPLKTFQVSLFAQTPEKSEKAVDKTEKQQDMGKAKAGKMDGKQYKDESRITVKNPTLLEQSEENRIFSGPQPGEKLPPLTVTGVGGRIDGTTFDMTMKADGKPLILFLQDTNAVGIKGLVNVFKLLLQIDAHQKRQSQATGTETPNQGLQIGVVFLADNLDTLPEWARNMLKEEIPNVVLTGLSPDGREGPGSYGLNRNVAQTVLIAKDGQVLHNFAFTQPMLYADPHFLGAIAQAIEVEPATLEKWLNEATAKRSDKKKVKAVIIKENDDTSGDAPEWVELRNLTDEELNMKGWTFNLVTTELDTEGKLIRTTNDEKLIRFTNDVEIPAGKVKYVIINDSDGTSGDTHDWMELRNPTDGDTSEWLELRNPTDKELNLKGWALEIVPTVLDTKGKRIRFTNNVKIPPDSYLILVRSPESLKKLGSTLEEDEQPQKGKEERGGAMEKDDARNREQGLSPEEQRKQAREKLAQMKEHGRTIEKDDARNREQNPSPEEQLREAREKLAEMEALIKRLDKDGDGKLNREEGMAARRALANRENQNRYRRENVEVKNPAEFKKAEGAAIFSGPQPGEKLLSLKVKGINGETKGKTSDVIAKADGQLLVLFLQDESGLGLRGLLGISRLLAQIAEKSKQAMHISAVFLGDTPDTVENQVSRLVPHIPSGVSLGISQDGREGPGSYGLNRNVAQTVIIAKDGKVLHNFAFTQPMLRPDPYVLGAVGEAIGIKPATLEKWLNPQNPVIEIKNPAEGGETGKMLLNGNIVQFDELLAHLLNLPDEQKSTLIIQSGRDVPHEQIVKVMDIAKEAGIDKIEFAMRPSENKRMESGKEQMRREYSDEIAALRKRISEATKKVEEMRKQVEETRKRHEDAVPNREQHGNED